MRLFIGPVGSGVTLELPEKASVKDDGKGGVEGKERADFLFHFNSETGLLTAQSHLIVREVENSKPPVMPAQPLPQSAPTPAPTPAPAPAPAPSPTPPRPPQ